MKSFQILPKSNVNQTSNSNIGGLSYQFIAMLIH